MAAHFRNFFLGERTWPPDHRSRQNYGAVNGAATKAKVATRRAPSFGK